jgi:acetylornithine deacetylase/succinyl-diaminopimelate desuccinylase-like protein
MNAPLHRELPATLLDSARALDQVTRQWDGDIVRQLTDYIAIPAKSPGFDPQWQQHGYIETVLRNAAGWVEAQKVAGLKLEIVRLPGRTPVLFFEVEGTKAAATQTILMYGHLDKQPEFTGWRNDLGPWTPKYEDGKLYGRGGADDGYAVYASIAAIQALKSQGKPHPRIVGLIETCEESGSYDLLPYVDALRPRLGDVGLVICLDSGAGNYEQLWLTTSLRGWPAARSRWRSSPKACTRGMRPASCLRASASCGRCSTGWRTARRAGCCRPASIAKFRRSAWRRPGPPPRSWGTRSTSASPGRMRTAAAPACSRLPTTTEPVQALINRTWTPDLSVTGAEGFPALQDAGNVLRPYTAFKLSLRLPPLIDAGQAVQELKTLLEDNAPYQAKVTFEGNGAASGWNAPPDHALVRAGPQCGLGGAFRRAGGLHRPGRHHSADEHAEPGLPGRADDGVRGAGSAQQCARTERVPARSLRQTSDRGRGRGDGADALNRSAASDLGPFPQPGH